MNTMWSTVRGLVYAIAFGVAGYAVVADDRQLISWSLPFVLAICGWWFWTDISASVGRWQRDREVRAKIVNERLDLLEGRVAELESRLDGL